MLREIGHRDDDAAQETVISLGGLRNMSHADGLEFVGFRIRFAEVLTEAGRPHGVTFRGTPGPSDYRVLGTAYLDSRGGFDQWVLHISLARSDEAWTVWEARRPVRVLRNPRPGQPQILPTR
jgi:hypothetical protein